jgi:hypothetical protein
VTGFVIEWAAAGARGRASHLTVEQQEGLIDAITVGFKNFSDSNTLSNASESPCTVSVSGGWSSTVDLCGYVDSVQTSQSRALAGDSIVSVLGCSDVLRSGEPRVFSEGALLSEIAASVVRPYRLGLEVDDVELSRAPEQGAAEGDWQFLARLAAGAGRSLVEDSGVLRFVDPARELGRSSQYPVILVKAPSTLGGNVGGVRVVENSTPADTMRRNLVYRGVDPQGNEFTVDSRKMLGQVNRFNRAAQHGSVTSVRQALNDVRRLSQTRRKVKTISFTGNGDFRIRPGRCIAVDSPDSSISGVWYVTSATHSLNIIDSSFTTSVVVDDLTGDAHRPAPIPYGERAAGRTPPAPVLLGDRWVLPWQWERFNA